MTVSELKEQLAYFPEDAILFYGQKRIDGCYYTRDFLPDAPYDPDAKRTNIVVMI